MKKPLKYVVKRKGVFWPSNEMKKIANISDEKILNSEITINELIESAQKIIQKWKNENT